MASAIKLVAGDNRPYIQLTLTNPDGTIVNVSSAVVTVRFRAAGTTSILSTITCTAPNGGADGVVVFNFPGATLDVPEGQYEGEININFGNDSATIYDILKFHVRPHF